MEIVDHNMPFSELRHECCRMDTFTLKVLGPEVSISAVDLPRHHFHTLDDLNRMHTVLDVSQYPFIAACFHCINSYRSNRHEVENCE